MLFGFPIEAAQDNWLHECICEIVTNIHTGIDQKQVLPGWPGIVPPPHRDTLRNRPGLKDRVNTYAKAVAKLTTQERQNIAGVMKDQNCIADLLSCKCDCDSIDSLPKNIKVPVLELFGFGFKMLSDFGVRDRQYKIIHEGMSSKVCPFCGCEMFSSPKGLRETLDHYLAKSLYPFAAANLRNLVPMGHKCNSQYKLTQDILRMNNGMRRRAFDPYSTDNLQLILNNSIINQSVDGPLVSEWRVEFSSEKEETQTWDKVFSIRERYKRDFLDVQSFTELLREFQYWCISATREIYSDQDLIDALERYEQYQSSLGYSDRAFIKAAVFKMLLARCQEGCDRILPLMRNLANVSQVAEGISNE